MLKYLKSGSKQENFCRKSFIRLENILKYRARNEQIHRRLKIDDFGSDSKEEKKSEQLPVCYILFFFRIKYYQKFYSHRENIIIENYFIFFAMTLYMSDLNLFNKNGSRKFLLKGPKVVYIL